MSHVGRLAVHHRQMERCRNRFADVHDERWLDNRLRIADARRLPELGRVTRRGTTDNNRDTTKRVIQQVVLLLQLLTFYDRSSVYNLFAGKYFVRLSRKLRAIVFYLLFLPPNSFAAINVSPKTITRLATFFFFVRTRSVAYFDLNFGCRE